MNDILQMHADLDNMLASDKFRAKPEPRSRDIEQKLSCTIQMTAEVYKSVTEGEAPLGADGDFPPGCCQHGCSCRGPF